MVTDIEAEMTMRGKEADNDHLNQDLAGQQILSMIGGGSNARKLSIQASDVTSTCDGTNTEIDCDEQVLSEFFLPSDWYDSIEPATENSNQDMLYSVPPSMPVEVAQNPVHGSVIGQPEYALGQSYQAPNCSMHAPSGYIKHTASQECGHQIHCQTTSYGICGAHRDAPPRAAEAVAWHPSFDSGVKFDALTHGCVAPFQSWLNQEVQLNYPVGLKSPLKVSCQKVPSGCAPKALDPDIPTKKKVPVWTQRSGTQRSVTGIQDLQALCRIHHHACTSRYSPPNFDRDHQPCIQQ
jgi:hypothetical protein